MRLGLVQDTVHLFAMLFFALLCCAFLGAAAFTQWAIQQRAERGTLFGVTVDPKFWETVQGQDIFHRFSRILWAVSWCSCAMIGLAIWGHSSSFQALNVVVLASLVLLMVGSQIAYARGHKQTLPFAVPQNLVRTVSIRKPQAFSTVWQALYWAANALPLLAVIATAVYIHLHPLYRAPSGYEAFAASVQDTPAGLALQHFMRRTAITVFLLNYRVLFSGALLGGIGLWLAFAFLYSTRPVDWMGGEENSNRYQRRVMVCATLTSLLLILQDIFTAITPKWTGHAFLLATLALSGIGLFSLGVRVLLRLRLYGKRPYGMVDRTPDARWKWGFYYFDRNDPAWIVPSRFGTRHTLNWGNPAIAFPVLTTLCLFLIAFSAFLLPSTVARTMLRAAPDGAYGRNTKLIVRGGDRRPTVNLGTTLPLVGGEWAVYRLALATVEDSSAAKQDAADVLIGFAEKRPETKARVAHVLASHGLRMDVVQRLAEEAVARVERGTEQTNENASLEGDWRRAYRMAEAWDSLGWVNFKLGNLDAAERYCRSAWELGFQSLYAQHLAEIYQKRGDLQKAKSFFSEALLSRHDYNSGSTLLRLLPRQDVEQIVRDGRRRIGLQEVLFNAAVKPISVEGNLVLTSGKMPELHPGSVPATGDKMRDLATLQKAIPVDSFPVELPDAGPEVVMQRIQLHCSGLKNGRCMLFFVPVWAGPGETRRMQAEQGRWIASAEE